MCVSLIAEVEHHFSFIGHFVFLLLWIAFFPLFLSYYCFDFKFLIIYLTNNICQCMNYLKNLNISGMYHLNTHLCCLDIFKILKGETDT